MRAYLIEADDVWVVECLEDSDFAGNTLVCMRIG